MADVVYNFVGGIPYSVLYDSVRLAIRKSRKFRTHLVDLQLTLDSLEPRIIQQIGENFVELNLPNDIIEDLKTKMREGKELVDLLVELSVWNIRIWGNFCNCIGPDYAQQLIQLNTSLRILIDQLSLQDTRMLTEVLKELRKSNHDRDDMQKRLLKIESVNVEMLDLLKKQGIGRTESSNVQAIASSSGGGGSSVPYPALGVVFQQLCDVIIQAKVKNMMCKRLLQVFKLTLNCLQPLIEELEEYNEIFHLSEQQLLNLTGRIKNGVELVHKCTKVRKRANYIKFEKIRNNILDLNKFLQRLFLQLKCQAERNVKEAMASTREIEAGIKDIEGRGVLQIYELGRKGQSSGQGGQPPGPGDVIIRETVLVGSACVTEDQEVQPNEEETDYLVPQMETEGSPRVETFESESATRKMEVGVKETDEKSDEEEKNLHVWDNTILNCVPAVPTKRRMDESKRPAWYTPEPDLQDIQPLSYEDDHSYRSNKIPASPLHVPPSPRYSNSPRLCKLGSVHLNLSQIARATRNFSKSQLIGEGAFGTVYKARLADGQMVSIERAEKEFFKDLQTEFSSEVELLAEFDHRNLVKLLGYVNEGDERLIITEYVPNGNLREHLDCKYKKTLEFNQRLEIAIDIAHALTYLHLCSEKQIIHRDVKSSNILLTESMRAKVANFGFARLGPMDTDRTHISTKVKRTVGYLDPEYMKTYQLTPKSDVYSFGILLIEIMTGRRPVELKRPLVERVTLKWAFKKLSEGGVVDLIDPVMKERVDGQVLFKIFDLAIHCAAPIRADRPDMKTVGEQLWTIRADYLKSLKRG